MRVITGTARGRSLDTLKGEDIVRPTSQKIKESMFSAIQFIVAGAKVLDLFAGSGQLGIEALSRGADICVFVDNNREAIEIIKSNLKKTNLFQKAKVLTGDAGKYLAYSKDTFDIVFLDPPYGCGTVEAMLTLLEPCVAPRGQVVCETESGLAMPETAGVLKLKKNYRHGSTTVWLYQNITDNLLD